MKQTDTPCARCLTEDQVFKNALACDVVLLLSVV